MEITYDAATPCQADDGQKDQVMVVLEGDLKKNMSDDDDDDDDDDNNRCRRCFSSCFFAYAVWCLLMFVVSHCSF